MFRSLLLAPLGLFVGCTSNAEGPATGSNTNVTSVAPPPQDCPEAGCGEDQACVEVVPGGVRACRSASPPKPASDCPDHSASECCDNSECDSGLCVAGTYAPTGECGSGGVDSINVCYRDECQTDRDCSDDEVCAWGGTQGVQKQCLVAHCTRDADCTAELGGRCVFVAHACLYDEVGNDNERPSQLACAYPGNYCTDEADCNDDEYCLADDAGTRCMTL